MAFLQVGDNDVNGIPAVKLLSDNRLLKHCQVWICECATIIPFVTCPQECCCECYWIVPAHLTKTESVYSKFLQECKNKYVCLWQIRVLLLAEATASVRNRRECTCYPLHTHTYTRRYDIFWPGMCLQCICSDNQVFSQGFLMCSEQHKAIIFRSELLHDPM